MAKLPTTLPLQLDPCESVVAVVPRTYKHVKLLYIYIENTVTATIRDVCLQEEEIPFHLMPLFRVGESAHTELRNAVERLVEYAPTV